MQLVQVEPLHLRVERMTFLSERTTDMCCASSIRRLCKTTIERPQWWYISWIIPLTAWIALLRAVGLILEFERFMSENRIRLVDLLKKVDKDKDGSINEEELRTFLLLGMHS